MGKKKSVSKIVKKPTTKKVIKKAASKPLPKLAEKQTTKRSPKKKQSLDDSVLKNSKASKLAELLKKTNATAKKPVNFDKFAKDLEWSSDDLSESDLDILDDSEDGLVYAEDDDQDMELGGNTSEISEEEDSNVEDDDDGMITDDELEEVVKTESESEADFEIVKTVARIDPKSETALFEFVTQGKVAIKALANQEKKKSKKQLFAEESNAVYVDVKYKLPAYIKQNIGARKLIELPFPERNASNSSVCLILPDFSHKAADRRDPDVDKQAREWADILRDKFGITGRDVAKIITLTQLKRELGNQEACRKFIQTYDILLVDRSIFSSTVYHLGREVQKGGRLPIPFKILAKNVPEQIKKSYRLTQMDLRAGVCNVRIRIGNLTQGNNQLSANFGAVADAIFAYTPFGPKNIKTAQIVTDQQAIQLPFYVDFTAKAELEVIKPKVKHGETLTDEISTLADDLHVKVDNGFVTVIDPETGKVAKKTSGKKSNKQKLSRKRKHVK